MPFTPLSADTGEAAPQPKQGFTPVSTPLEYETSPIVERAKYVAGVAPGIAETAIGGAADFGGTIASGIGGIAYGALPAIHEGQKINWSDPNNPFYQEYAKEQGLWSRNISPVLAPQTEAGKDIMSGFGTVAEKMKGMGEKVTDITGSEAAGAFTEAGLQTLGIPLGLKAAGIIPMAGGGVAALLAKGKRAAGAPSGAPTAEGPRAPILGEASVADQLKAIRPVPPAEPVVSPEAPVAAPVAPITQGFTPLETAQPVPVSPEQAGSDRRVQFIPPSEQLRRDAEAYRKLQEDLKAGAPPPPEQPITPPPGAATFVPKPGDVPTAPRHASPGLPVQEIPLAGLKLSEDVPQFKKSANAEGIVAPLGGKFDRIGVAPIQIWERLNGDHEIISGRHRFDLAKRSGEQTIPAQIHREADGFTKDHAAILDAELNIRDEQGGVNDYANYFRTTGLEEETAKSRGLLARAKGRAGYQIANQASDEVFAAHGAGIISDEAALAFSRAAPKDSAAQAVGLKMLNEGRSINQAENTIRAIAMMQKNGEAKPEQGDIFGFDDSAIRQAEEMAKKASAAQRTIREQLAAVSGATKRPDIARKLGVDVKDPEAVKQSIDRLRAALDRLANWPLYPDLVREFRGEERPPMELKSETETEIKAKVAAKEKADEEARKKESAPPPEDFVMSSSTRPADEAAARGQNDMFGNTPLKPEEGKGIFDAVVQGMRRKAGERRAVEGKPLEGLAEDRRVSAAMRRREALTKGEPIEKAAKTKPPEKKQPQEPAKPVEKPVASSTHDSLKPHIETLIKRKRFADEIHLGRKLENAIDKAKTAMETGEGKSADFVKYAKWFRDKDPVTQKALLDIADTLKGKNVVRQDEAAYGEPAPAFYSQLSRSMGAAPDKVFGKGENVANWITANASKLGIKKAEIEATGLTDWLQTQAKVTKADVLNFLDQNGVQVEDVTLGGFRNEWEVLDENTGRRIGNTYASEREARDAANTSPVGENPIVNQLPSNETSGATKFASYQLPGGENYKELLLTLPVEKKAFDAQDALKEIERRRLSGEISNEDADKLSKAAYGDKRSSRQTELGQNEFRSSHYDQPNILAHVRFNERTDAEGKRVLFLEEIQSDWGQKGKKEGFNLKPEIVEKQVGDRTVYQVISRGEVFSEEVSRAAAEKVAAQESNKLHGIPSAPFVTDTKAWTALALKRMIRYAAENGFDRVAWTTGEQQADRYSLAKQIDSLMYAKRPDGTYQIKVVKNSGDAPTTMGSFAEKDLEDNVGKEIAKKIVAGEGRQVPHSPLKHLENVDLKVGGEGMKGYYDAIVPQVANDILKKLGGGKVESVSINANSDKLGDGGWKVFDEKGKLRYKLSSEASAQKELKAGWRIESPEQNQQGFTITPELRAKVMNEGMSLFQNRAQYDLFPEVAEKQAEVGMPKPKAEPVTPKQEAKAAREIKLEQNEAEPGIYYVTAKLEKVGERDLPSKVTTWQEAANATAYLSKFAVEHFDMIVTDKKGQPLSVIGSFKGAVAQASVYPATIAQELAKIKGAAHVWGSHNHPSGTAELSQSDRMLSDNIRNLLRGSGVEYHGLMAVGGDRWMSDAMEFERGEISKLPTEMVKAPIVERVTEGTPNEAMSLSAPREARRIIPEMAKDKPGIVFLSTQRNPVAFVPLDPEAIFPLRQDGRLMKLFNSAASTGAGAAIIANPKDVMSVRDMNNLGAALGSIDIRALDAISYDPENVATTVKSQADTGLWMPSSSIVQQKQANYGAAHNPSDYELFGGTEDDVHKIINFNIGITPKDLAKGAGKIAKDAKAVMERAKATKMGAAASEWMDAVKSDLQTKVVPMAAGTDRARAIAKDFANADRMSRWQWEKFDSTLKKSYTKEQREKMWNAAEDENQIRLEKLPEDQRKGRGLDRLTPEERATMDTLHQYGEDLLQRARDVGLFKGEGVEYWSPRIVAMIGEDGAITMPKDKGGGQGFTPYSSPTGGNISTKAGSLKARKHETVAGTEAAAKARFGEGAAVVKDIRTMPMAMARIERAIATRELIDQIKSVGEQTGQELVLNKQMEGFFTIDHPAFKTYRYRPDIKMRGEDFDVFPVYVSREFEGPLKAIMTDKPGKLYQAMMDMKGKSMSVIMYSPLIHNGVEWGRALPLMPGRIITFKAYFDGNMAKNNPAVMRELINDGMVPIGHRFFMQDISGIMEEPELQPGRSWTAKIAGGAVGLANKKAGEAVKKGIDTAGDFWHNTLLWDRIGDLQAGIAVNVKADLIKKGMDPQTAGRVSAHLANRFAGALPNEAMSANARKVANFMFFSRTFSLGNLGVMKDIISGLPRDVQAQILRDAGEASAFAAKGAAQKAAIKSVSIDIALMYGANAALQSGFDAIKRDKSLDDIEREYVERFDAMIKNVKEDPSNLLKPFGMLESLTPMSANEPGKEQRVLYDYDKTGTAIYVRLPTGKIGEEFLTWATSPLDILKRKEGTVARPIIQTLTNDRGFGRKVYDENLPGYKGAFKAVGNIAYNFLSQQFPTASLEAALDIARGQSDETDALKTIGPLFGLTFSKGAPGGEDVGMMFAVEREHRAEISDVMPDVKHALKTGNTEEAIRIMYSSHFTPQEIKATLKFAAMPRARMSPSALKKFYQTSSPEEQKKMEQVQERRQ